MQYWDIEKTGDWARDNDTGRAYFHQLSEKGPFALVYAAMTAVECGTWDGRHAGFFGEMAETQCNRLTY